MNPHPYKEGGAMDLLAELKKIIKTTREAVEMSPVGINGGGTAVAITSFILLAKHNGLTREQFIQAVNDVWDLM
jgi:hypothetical protein